MPREVWHNATNRGKPRQTSAGLAASRLARRRRGVGGAQQAPA